MNARRQTQGFTLLETLAALMIFAMTFSVLLELTGTALKQSRRADESTKAALHAASVMDAMGVGEVLKLGQDSGKFEDGYTWEAKISEYEVPPDPTADASITTLRPETGMRLFQIDLRVMWGRPPNERHAEFKTLRALRPDSLPTGGK